MLTVTLTLILLAIYFVAFGLAFFISNKFRSGDLTLPWNRLPKGSTLEIEPTQRPHYKWRATAQVMFGKESMTLVSDGETPVLAAKAVVRHYKAEKKRRKKAPDPVLVTKAKNRYTR